MRFFKGIVVMAATAVAFGAFGGVANAAIADPSTNYDFYSLHNHCHLQADAVGAGNVLAPTAPVTISHWGTLKCDHPLWQLELQSRLIPSNAAVGPESETVTRGDCNFGGNCARAVECGQCATTAVTSSGTVSGQKGIEYDHYVYVYMVTDGDTWWAADERAACTGSLPTNNYLICKLHQPKFIP